MKAEGLTAAEDLTPEEAAEVTAMRRQMGRSLIRQWKINKSLYEQYGGRIIYQQLNDERGQVLNLELCRLPRRNDGVSEDQYSGPDPGCASPEINLSTVFAGQIVGIREVDDPIWLVSFLDYDPGFFDKDEGRVEPGPNPFDPETVLTMSAE